EPMETSTSMTGVAKMKTVYAITERGGRSFWTKIGVGFANRDGSISLRLDAVPVNGTMQVRDYEPREWERKSREVEPNGRSPIAFPNEPPGAGIPDNFPESFS